MGGEINYRCVGNKKYEVFLKVYRDCNTSSFTPDSLLASCGSNAIKFAISNKVSDKDVTGVGANCADKSKCQGGNLPFGVNEEVWKLEIDLSAYNCCDWTFSWQHCCRSNQITTGLANQAIYLYAKLNTCLAACNQSPTFLGDIRAIRCLNQNIDLNISVTDTTDLGDSISYQLMAPMQSANQFVQYNGLFSAQRPLTFSGFPHAGLAPPNGLNLDQQNGILSFKPTENNQVTVIAIQVKEWRKINNQMQEISSIIREIPLIVLACPSNTPPVISPPYHRSVVEGQQVCISIATSDADNSDTVRISWNQGIQGATFTHNNGFRKHANGEVCWTPTTNDVSDIPYHFTITATDNGCLSPSSTSQTFGLRVLPIPRATPVITKAHCGLLKLNHIPLSKGEFNTFWLIRNVSNELSYSSIKVQDSLVLPPGTYQVRLSLTNQVPVLNRYIDTVIIEDYLSSSARVNIEQKNDTLIADEGFWQYTWFNDQEQALQKGPSNIYKLVEPGFYTVKVTDSLKCNEIASPLFVVSSLATPTVHHETIDGYPNPALVGQLITLNSQSAVHSIHDITGKEITVEETKSVDQHQIRFRQAGVYFLKFENGKTLKVVVF